MPDDPRPAGAVCEGQPATTDDVLILPMIQQSDDTRSFAKQATVKETDPTEQIATGVVMVPDQVDHQRDYARPWAISALEAGYAWRNEAGTIEDLVMHVRPSGTDSETVSSRVLEASAELGGREYPAGTWVIDRQYHDDQLWSLVEDGVLGSFSIGGHITDEVEYTAADLPTDVDVPDDVTIDEDETVSELRAGYIDEISDVDRPAVPFADAVALKGDAPSLVTTLAKNDALTNPDRAADILVDERGHNEADAERLAEYLAKAVDDDGATSKPNPDLPGGTMEACIDRIMEEQNVSEDEAAAICQSIRQDTHDNDSMTTQTKVDIGDAVRWDSDAGGDTEPDSVRYGVVVDGLQDDDDPDDSLLVAVYEPADGGDGWENRQEEEPIQEERLETVGDDGVASLPPIDQIEAARMSTQSNSTMSTQHTSSATGDDTNRDDTSELDQETIGFVKRMKRFFVDEDPTEKAGQTLRNDIQERLRIAHDEIESTLSESDSQFQQNRFTDHPRYDTNIDNIDAGKSADGGTRPDEAAALTTAIEELETAKTELEGVEESTTNEADKTDAETETKNDMTDAMTETTDEQSQAEQNAAAIAELRKQLEGDTGDTGDTTAEKDDSGDDDDTDATQGNDDDDTDIDADADADADADEDGDAKSDDGEESESTEEAPEWAKDLQANVQQNAENIAALAKSAGRSHQLEQKSATEDTEDEDDDDATTDKAAFLGMTD